MRSTLICIFLLSTGLGLIWSYQVPKAQVRVFSPKGFEVSIPHEDGISFVAFFGKLNERFNGLENGRWSQDINQSDGGRWTFRDQETALKICDTLYYWTYVRKDGFGYREDNGEFRVIGYSK